MISVMGFEKRDDIRINKNRGRYFNRCKTEKDAEIKCQNPYKLDIRHSNKFELKKKKTDFDHNWSYFTILVRLVVCYGLKRKHMQL